MRLSATFPLWLLLACSEQPQVQALAFVEVESVGIHPLCDRTQDLVADEALRIAGALGLENPDMVSVRLGPIEEVHDRCQIVGEELAGCTYRRDGEVIVEATLTSLTHELVHALRHQHEGARLGSLFEEGLAEVISSGAIRTFATNVPARDPIALLDSVDAPAQDISYLVAGHFVAWLRQRYGADLVLAMYSEASSAAAAERFEEHLNVSLEEAAAEWSTDAPTEIALADQCANSIPLSWDGDELELELDLSCDADASGPWQTGDGGERVSRSLCFEVDELAELELSFVSDSPTLELELSIVECSAPGSSDALAPKVLGPTSEPISIPFAPCTWQGSITDDLDAGAPLQLTLRR